MNKKGLYILGAIVALCIISGIYCATRNSSKQGESAPQKKFEKPKSFFSFSTSSNSHSKYAFSKEYIAVLYIEGIITDEGKTYNQKFMLDTLKFLEEDPLNVGLMLFLDTPGGSVYEGDQLYLKLLSYKEKTNRPIYAYMGSMAASCGYYLACSAEKIIANRNTLTGSIGVIMGQSFDLTELMEKYGIKSTTIHSGKNKNMMSFNEPFSDEQKSIMQELCDETYQQFVEIVSESRQIPLETVLKLADGRIFSAKQSLKNGLIDEILSYDDAIEEFKKKIVHDRTFDMNNTVETGESDENAPQEESEALSQTKDKKQKKQKKAEEPAVEEFKYEEDINFLQMLRNMSSAAANLSKAMASGKSLSLKMLQP